MWENLNFSEISGNQWQCYLTGLLSNIVGNMLNNTCKMPACADLCTVYKNYFGIIRSALLQIKLQMSELENVEILLHFYKYFPDSPYIKIPWPTLVIRNGGKSVYDTAWHILIWTSTNIYLVLSLDTLYLKEYVEKVKNIIWRKRNVPLSCFYLLVPF